MRKYHVRYMVEVWDKPVPEEVKTIKEMEGIIVSNSDYGFCDDIFIASIIKNKHGEVASILLLDSVNLKPGIKMLELIKAQIEHQIENHTTEK